VARRIVESSEAHVCQSGYTSMKVLEKLPVFSGPVKVLENRIGP